MSRPWAGRPRVAVVVGNPRPGSRTLAAATHVAGELVGPVGEPDLVVDLGTLGTRLLDPASAVEVDRLVAQVGAADLVVVATPVYKASYTGLLKVFLDRFAGGTGLTGVVVPLVLAASPAHALVGEHHLRPVLTELGATVPGRALFVLDSTFDDPAAYADWLAATRPVVHALLAGREAVAS